MGFWKKLFGFEKEEIIEEQKIETPVQEIEQETIENKPLETEVNQSKPSVYCEHCKEAIIDDRAMVHELGKLFHKQCARKLRKQAKKVLYGTPVQ